MLVEQGIDSRACSNVATYETQLDAFAAVILDANDIEGACYDQLAEWSSQAPLDRVLVQLFDERDGAANSAEATGDRDQDARGRQSHAAVLWLKPIQRLGAPVRVPDQRLIGRSD